MQATLVSQPSQGSTVSSVPHDHQMKIKLRLAYGGRFVKSEGTNGASSSWAYVGGEFFNESVPYGIRYADFMFKLAEKFRTAVSVKYAAPGEELGPEQLISVQDDADLQELVEDYMGHLARPGTPSKTFRIKVFVFMAAEEPLTPDEIMAAQHFFGLECSQPGGSGSGLMPPRLAPFRNTDGRSSLGSTLSSVGTPSTRQHELAAAADWPSSSVVGPLLPGGEEPPFDEQEALERVRQAVSGQLPMGAFAQGPAGAYAGGGAAAAAGGQDASSRADSCYNSEEMDEVLAAIQQEQQHHQQHPQQQQWGSNGAATPAAAPAGSGGGGSLDSRFAAVAHLLADDDDAASRGVHAAAAGGSASASAAAAAADDDDAAYAAELGIPADPWEILEAAPAVACQQAADAAAVLQQQQQRVQLAEQPSVDSKLRALPDRLSDFGDDDAVGGGGEGSSGLFSPPAAAAAVSPLTEADLLGGAGGTGGGGGGRSSGLQLPSHISAFGDDLAALQPGHNQPSLSTSSGGLMEDEDAAAAAAFARRPPSGGGGVLGGCGALRTQDSRFSLDGADDVAGLEGDGLGGGGGGPERAGSGDSLGGGLPKLQPVHRLAKPDLRIVQRIGEGAFGEVSVAKAPLYGTVAVKWLKSERFSKHFASFGREAALLADLNHPNVLRFYGVVTQSASDPTVIGIMTEYIKGGSMSAFLRMSRCVLPLRVRCELALGAANGLAYLHELRIVHFDLKPDNLLLDAPLAIVRAAAGCAGGDSCQQPGHAGAAAGGGAAGGGGGSSGSQDIIILQRGGSGAAAGINTSPAAVAAAAAAAAAAAGGGVLRTTSGAAGDSGAAAAAAAAPAGAAGVHGSGGGHRLLAEALADMPVVKVADFGLSKHKLNSSYVSSCRDLRGTLPYMAPELVADPERVCEKADVWSLGVVMWEMLTREIPFQDCPPQQILLALMTGNIHLPVPEWCEPEWRGLLEACLEPNPCNRPTMRELSRQLEAIRDQVVQQEQEELEQVQQQQQHQQPLVQEDQQQQQRLLQEAQAQHQQQLLHQQEAHQQQLLQQLEAHHLLYEEQACVQQQQQLLHEMLQQDGQMQQQQQQQAALFGAAPARQQHQQQLDSQLDRINQLESMVASQGRAMQAMWLSHDSSSQPGGGGQQQQQHNTHTLFGGAGGIDTELSQRAAVQLQHL